MTVANPVAPGIAVFNATTVKSDEEIRRGVAACSRQLVEHFCPDYSKEGVEVVFYADKTQIPAGMQTVPIADRCDEPGALAYHSVGHDGRVTGLVGVLTCEEDGQRWEPALSHEALEASFDPWGNKWFDMPDGRTEMAGEDADPVQDQTYEIDGIPVSNYVLPEWFNPYAPDGAQFDRLGSLSAPFTRTDGGYFITRDARGKTTTHGVRAKHRCPEGRGAKRAASGRADALDADTLQALIEQAHADGPAVAQVVTGTLARLRAARAKAARKGTVAK